MNSAFAKTVYCLPIVPTSAIPIPDLKFRRLLESNGMQASVDFLPNTSPARVRENISKAFRESFGLRSQELLQFDYLSVVPGKSELTKPKKLLHFDSKTILSFVGQSNVYITLRQQPQIDGIDWKELLFKERYLKPLMGDQYKKVMLSVMHRLSAGKHKDTANEAEMRLTESLLDNYKLNEFHQLVFTGNCFDQLVLFTENRREEAFKVAHLGVGHHDLTTTFKRMYTSYYWNNILEWVTEKVMSCPGCDEVGDGHDNIAIDTIVDDIVAKNVGKNVQAFKKSFVSNPAAPLYPVKTTSPVPTPKLTVPTLQPQRPLQSSISSPGFAANRTDNMKAASMVVVVPQKQGRLERGARKRAIERMQDEETEDSSDDETVVYAKKQQCDLSGGPDGLDLKHSAKVLSSMYEMQKRETYCDFFITLLPSNFNGLRKPKVYRTHKAVLATLSPRVRKIRKAEVKIGGKVTNMGLLNVIEYIYTGKIANIMKLSYNEVTNASTAALALDIEINTYIKRNRPDFAITHARVVLNKKPDARPSLNPTDHVINDENVRIKAEVVALPVDSMDPNNDFGDDQDGVYDQMDNGDDEGDSDSEPEADSPEWRPGADT